VDRGAGHDGAPRRLAGHQTLIDLGVPLSTTPSAGAIARRTNSRSPGFSVSGRHAHHSVAVQAVRNSA